MPTYINFLKTLQFTDLLKISTSRIEEDVSNARSRRTPFNANYDTLCAPQEVFSVSLKALYAFGNIVRDKYSQYPNIRIK